MCVLSYFFFFFQAEDGIRDYKVTGVQTCALPISIRSARESVLSPHLPRGPQYPEGSRRDLRCGGASRGTPRRGAYRRVGALRTPRRERSPVVAGAQRGGPHFSVGRRPWLRGAARLAAAGGREVRARRCGEPRGVRLAG